MPTPERVSFINSHIGGETRAMNDAETRLKELEEKVSELSAWKAAAELVLSPTILNQIQSMVGNMDPDILKEYQTQNFWETIISIIYEIQYENKGDRFLKLYPLLRYLLDMQSFEELYLLDEKHFLEKVHGVGPYTYKIFMNKHRDKGIIPKK